MFKGDFQKKEFLWFFHSQERSYYFMELSLIGLPIVIIYIYIVDKNDLENF